jgi:hypothetical protein
MKTWVGFWLMRGPSRRCFCFVRRRTNVPDLVIVGTFLRARSEWSTNEVRHYQVESSAIPYSGLGRSVEAVLEAQSLPPARVGARMCLMEPS